MAFIEGRIGTVYTGSNQVIEVTGWTYAGTADEYEVISTDVEDKRHGRGLRDGNGTFNCNMDPGDTTGQESILEGDTIELHLYPEDNVTGKDDYTGNVLVTQVDMAGDPNSAVQRNYTFVGRLTKTVVP